MGSGARGRADGLPIDWRVRSLKGIPGLPTVDKLLVSGCAAMVLQGMRPIDATVDQRTVPLFQLHRGKLVEFNSTKLHTVVLVPLPAPIIASLDDLIGSRSRCRGTE
jgi:hypothetical protein